MRMEKNTALEQAILLAVGYCDQFAFPLTKREIFLRLPYLGFSVEEKKLDLKLSELIKDKKIENSQGFFFLPGKAAHVETRLRREKISAEKWQQASAAASFMQKLPWITGVLVTGSLAMNNGDEESDVDFMIVTKPSRLWLSRFFVTMFAQLKGKRRSWKGEEENSWCFNLWVDERSLSFKESASLYTAYELTQAVPLLERGELLKKLYKENTWITQYLPSSEFHHNFLAPKKNVFSSSEKGSVFLEKVMDLLDWLAWKTQLWYMAPHRTTEKVGRGFAFFHPRDTKRMISDSLRKSLLMVFSQEDIDTILEQYGIERAS